MTSMYDKLCNKQDELFPLVSHICIKMGRWKNDLTCGLYTNAYESMQIEMSKTLRIM